MKRTVVGLALLLASVGAWAGRGMGQPAGGKLSAFMRPKLGFSKEVLEGVTLGDFERIVTGARGMKDLSSAAEWKVTQNVSYLRRSLEFQLLADELIAKAREKNLDGATLAYVKLTMNCVDCHKYFRENPIIPAVPTR
jgi:hypothetical protein